MPDKHQLTKQELESHLQEQLAFIMASAEAYDRGYEGEAKRLAAALRILLHDSRNSHSLLGQMNRKQIRFFDSSIIDYRIAAAPCHLLTMVGVAASRQCFIPCYDDSSSIRWRDFDEWWNMPVIKDTAGNCFTRSGLVRTMADQDGGAHVDHELDERYARLSQQNTMGLYVTTVKGEHPLDGPEKATVRQIAHEVLRTLVSDYPEKHSMSCMAMFQDMCDPGPTSVSSAPGAGLPSEFHKAVPKVGANMKCPCGSGMKYKRCHGAVR